MMNKLQKTGHVFTLLFSFGIMQSSYAAEWKIQPKPLVQHHQGNSESILIVYLYYEGNTPRLSKIGSVEDSRFERILINKESKEVYLNAEEFETTGDKEKYKNIYQCKSTPDITKREIYSLCSSRFGLKVGSGYEVNQQLLLNTLDKVKLNNHITQNNSEQYEIDYIESKSKHRIKDFIEKYKDNDPKNYIEKAKERLKSIQIKEYREMYRDIEQAPDEIVKIIYIKNFISTFENNDPENLVKSLRALLPKLQQSQNIKRTTVGTKVCTTTFGEVETACSLENPRSCMTYDHYRYKGTITISGFVENVNPPNIKITTNGIKFQSYGDNRYYNLDGTTYNGGKLQAGTPFWDRIDAWNVCHH